MSGTDATGIPARDGDGNTIPPPIAPAPVNPVAPPAPLAQDVSDTVILTAIGTLTSALGEMALLAEGAIALSVTLSGGALFAS